MVRHAELVRVNQHLIRGRGYVSWVSFAWKGFCSETLALYISKNNYVIKKILRFS